MVRPRQEQSGLSKQPRGEEGAVSKGDRGRASIMARCKPAQSPLAEREQERECGAGVSQNTGLERVHTRVLRFHLLLCCCAGSVLGATCCWLPLLHLMEARLEFISPAAGCIIALARRRRMQRGRGQRRRRGRGAARGEARLRGWATAPRRNAYTLGLGQTKLGPINQLKL